MEGFFALVILVLIGIVVIPIVALVTQARRLRSLEASLRKVSERLDALERSPSQEKSSAAAARASMPPPAILQTPVSTASTPPPLPVPLTIPPPARSPINFEAFLGVKLFAWLGGFILFLGLAFLVKYAFDNNLITPALRILLGATIGLALLAAGAWAVRKNYRVPGQSLCATGILVLYANIFSAHVYYQLIALGPAFGLMLCVTAAAFLLALLLDAQVVVILGMLGGFLTPILLNAGREQPAALFGYIALLNAGVAATALRKHWNHLVLLAAIATVLMVVDWTNQFMGARPITSMLLFVAFEFEFLLVVFLKWKEGGAEKWTTTAAAVAGFAALVASWWMLDFIAIREQRPLLFGYVFVADVGLLMLALRQRRPETLATAAGLIVFGFLAFWTSFYLTPSLLWWALGSYLVFALLHAWFSVKWGKRHSLAALCAAAPFLLLGLANSTSPSENPTPIFGLAFVLAALLLGMGIVWRANWIAVVALGGCWGIERAWLATNFSAAHSAVPLAFVFVFALLFIGFPFFARAKEQATPWGVSAVSGAAHFWLVYQIFVEAFPASVNGLLPAAFIVPYAFGVFYLLKIRRIEPATGDAKLAWQGAAALLFVSLIFPIQFSCEWITLGWALEGLALIWLFRRVPHRGLRLVALLLLSAAFIRLALNPAVLDYHPRTGVKIWNWYLYAYGVTSVCLLLGARLFRPVEPKQPERYAPAFLYSLGGILLFLLLNLEIADYFSIGPTLTFSFSGNFARDMTYSIAWAIFAFGLLLIGMSRKASAVRYAGLGLLIITLAKLFLHDLGNLNQLYRIGAFIGVAIILIVASFLYQRFGVSATPRAE